MVVTAVMARTHPRSKPLPPPAWLLLWLVPGMASAASDWKTAVGLTVGERFTDNVSLSANDPESAFITEVTPRIGMTRRGKRGQAHLAYGLQGLIYDSGRSEASHDLDAGMQVEPVTGVLKLNGAARVGQHYASRLGQSAAEFYHDVANRVETRTVTLTPSLHNEFFERSLITDASLGLHYASSDSASLSSSSGHTLNLSLRSGPRPQRLTYSGSYNRSSGEASGASTTTLEREQYNIAYAIQRRSRVFLSAGRNASDGINSLSGLGGRYVSTGVVWAPADHYNLTASIGESGGNAAYSLSGAWIPSRKLTLAATLGKRNDANAYSVSGNWVPSVLTQISASAQKNFDNNTFGVDTATNGLSAYGQTSYSLDVRHRLRRAALGLRYHEAVVEASQQLNQAFTSDFYLCPNSIGTGFTTSATQNAENSCFAPGTLIQSTQLLNQTTYNKTWAGTLNFSLGKSALAFTLNQSRRQYLGTATGGGDTQTGATASWSLPVSGRTRTSLGLHWSTAETSGQESDLWSINWLLTHQISPRVSSSFTARHSEQSATGSTGTIKENSVSAQLGMTF